MPRCWRVDWAVPSAFCGQRVCCFIAIAVGAERLLTRSARGVKFALVLAGDVRQFAAGTRTRDGWAWSEITPPFSSERSISRDRVPLTCLVAVSLAPRPVGSHFARSEVPCPVDHIMRPASR